MRAGPASCPQRGICRREEAKHRSQQVGKWRRMRPHVGSLVGTTTLLRMPLMAAQLEKEVTWELLGGTGDRSEMPRRREGQAREGQQKATQKEVGRREVLPLRSGVQGA